MLRSCCRAFLSGAGAELLNFAFLGFVIKLLRLLTKKFVYNETILSPGPERTKDTDQYKIGEDSKEVPYRYIQY